MHVLCLVFRSLFALCRPCFFLAVFLLFPIAQGAKVSDKEG